MIAVTFGGSTYPWDSGASIALWVVFGVCLISYLLQQYFALSTTYENRIFPVHFLKSRSLILLYTATGGAAAANAVTLYYISLFFQFTRRDSSIQAAVRLLPQICVFIFFVMVAGGSLPIVGRYNIYYILGGPLILIGGSLMFTINSNTSVSHIYGYESLIASGCGVVFQNAYAVSVARLWRKISRRRLASLMLGRLGLWLSLSRLLGPCSRILGSVILRALLRVMAFRMIMYGPRWRAVSLPSFRMPTRKLFILLS
jgi:hypothetical protein